MWQFLLSKTNAERYLFCSHLSLAFLFLVDLHHVQKFTPKTRFAKLPLQEKNSKVMMMSWELENLQINAQALVNDNVCIPWAQVMNSN